MSGWVVTGTDTGIGKTVTAAALCRCLHDAGQQVVYVKPVQSGAADGDDDAADVSALADVPTFTGPVIGPSLAPAVAARLAGDTLLLAELLDVVREAREAHPDAELVVEGAGGLLVELTTDRATVAELAEELELPLVVVVRAGLGTLNHTALTLEAARRRGIEVAGIVVARYPADPDLATITNGAELDMIADRQLLGVVPDLVSPAPDDLAGARDWFAPSLGGHFDRTAWLAASAAHVRSPAPRPSPARPATPEVPS